MAFELGLNEFASTNKIIMVYPDSECWDNHGSVDEDNFMTKDGLYPRTFMNMIDRLTTECEGDQCTLPDRPERPDRPEGEGRGDRERGGRGRGGRGREGRMREEGSLAALGYGMLSASAAILLLAA